MSRTLRLPALLALCAVTGIIGLLLVDGPVERPLLALVALPLIYGIYARHSAKRRAAGL